MKAPKLHLTLSTLYQAANYQRYKTTPHSIQALYQAANYQRYKTTPHSIQALYQSADYHSPNNHTSLYPAYIK